MIYLLGYPGDVGGACTEAWHTVKLWRACGWDVSLIPTWFAAKDWIERTAAIGCRTHRVSGFNDLPNVPDLAGSIVVGFCNAEFLTSVPTLRKMGCKLVWANCMSFLFDNEKRICKSHGLFDAFMFQSEYQRSKLLPELSKFGPVNHHLIRGAFDFSDWDFKPRPHASGETFFIGRAARPDLDKWSSNTWSIYNRINYENKRGIMLGVEARTLQKLKPPPQWIECLKPNEIPAREFFSRIHATMPINGGAGENWPRVGLEAMAVGVPVVAQNDWGWREQIIHGETGYLGNDDAELAHFASVLANDEPKRLQIAARARDRVTCELANPEIISNQWYELFNSI